MLRSTALILIATLAWCSPEKPGEARPSQPAVTETPQAGLPELARFLAGKTEPDDSRLGKLAARPEYKQHKQQVSSIWSMYTKDFSEPLAEWRTQNVPAVKSRTVFYPFAGPDFPNANTIYPGGDTYIMIGLEPAGGTPDLAAMNDHKVFAELRRMLQSVDYVSRRSYFITSFMNQSYIITEGTAPVILLYLGLLDFIPYSVKAIDLDENGKIKYLTDEEVKQYRAAHKWTHVEVRFQAAAGQPLKTIYYFKQDVQDEALEKDPRLLKYLGSLPQFASVFKAASYLIHYETFSKIGNLVVDKSELIVMDDTGPRIKKLQDNYDITVFGRYGRPIPPFQSQYQNDLVKLYRDQKPEPIKFRYGYGGQDGSRGILLVTRKKANASADGQTQPEK